MPAINIPSNITKENLIVKLKEEKRVSVEYQERRHEQWNENYLLYRDTVELNRLTQRQAVNVPLIKETVKAVMSKIGEEPEVLLVDKGGDEDKELVVNAMWDTAYDDNLLCLIDKVDKKQVILYGRSHVKHNWQNGAWTMELKDIFDVVVDPKTKPIDIQSARHIEELHIYKPLEEILVDTDRYDADALAQLKGRRVEAEGEATGGAARTKTQVYKEDADARNERLVGLGAQDLLLDFDGYDQIIELNQHYTMIWDKEKKKYVRYVCLMADRDILLRAEPLKEALGIDEWPFDTWADDLEATDYWSDGIVDSIRTINQVINIWVSQLVENRTLRNFGMNFYDSTASENFTPQGYDPQPGAWYPLPGKPSDVYQRVDIGDIGSVIDDIKFMVSLAEKASATGAIDKGVVEAGQRTLGEVQIAVSNALERTTSMSAYYKVSWKRLVQRWYNLLDANSNPNTTIKLYKKNNDGKIKGGEFTKKDWASPEGYQISILSYQEQLTSKTEELQRLQAVRQMFPSNPPLNKAIQKRSLGIVDLQPEEKKEIMDYEEEQQKKLQSGELIQDENGNIVQNPNAVPATPEAAPIDGNAVAGELQQLLSA